MSLRFALTAILASLLAHTNTNGEWVASETACVPFDEMARTLRELEERSNPQDCPNASVVHAVKCTDHGGSNVSIVHSAATMGLDTALSQLLECGADMNARDSIGNTPIVSAVWGGALTPLARLLAHGADPNLTNHAGWTAVHHLVAIAPDRMDMLDRLVAAGADLNRQDVSGTTVLHLAVSTKGQFELVESLLRHGADPHAIAEGAATALHVAAANCDAVAVQLLLSHGADATEMTAQGMTPAQLAAMSGCADLFDAVRIE